MAHHFMNREFASSVLIESNFRNRSPIEFCAAKDGKNLEFDPFCESRAP